MSEVARELILEYAAELGIDLSFQDLERELAELPDYYEAIVVAYDAQGCVALRRIDERTCEMKRLYVRPASRGTGLGRRLAEQAIDEARRHGYERMRLDTLPQMRAAMGLYESLGFREIEPYRFNPVPGVRFLELEL